MNANIKSGITVALIAIPLSIALSVASGAGPVPGVITGVWATLIAGIFGGSNYNIVGAAGALTTVLFAATLGAPLGLGAAILPIIALMSGALIFVVWAIGADRFLYYIPSSVMYGFAAGVAFLIAASQLFDATGLSTLKRTGTLIGDIQLFIAHLSEVQFDTLVLFGIFLVFILAWKRIVPNVPAVIPAAVLGIIVGVAADMYLPSSFVTLGDKFGSFSTTLYVPVSWFALPEILFERASLLFVLGTSTVVALISVLETLITAQLADKITKTQHSPRRELLGLALANIGSGIMGGLPATGVFIRTGANIKAGATHRTSALVAAAATAIIALVALPYFIYIPMAVIAAILVNTAIGLIEFEKFKDFFVREMPSFLIALVVLAITVFEDAGTGVMVGAILALLLFADHVSHGYFDAVLNFEDGSHTDLRSIRTLTIPDRPISFVTYSIAGFLGYIDASRHAHNLRLLAAAPQVCAVVIRLRNLFAIDYEGEEMLTESIQLLESSGKKVYLTSLTEMLRADLAGNAIIASLEHDGAIFNKSEDAVRALGAGGGTVVH